MTEERLRQSGFRKIKSEAHASQLLRREIKKKLKVQQRTKDNRCSLAVLLKIKAGNWFKFFKSCNPKLSTVMLIERATKKKAKS